MNLFKYIIATAGLLTIAISANAQEIAPDALIRNVSSEVLEIVRKDKDIQSGRTNKAIELVETKVLPHFNFDHMTRLAVGKDWRQASADQQKALAAEFRTLLVRTYSKALTEYRNETIKFKPLSLKPDDTDVRVRTEINQGNSGKPVSIDYYMEKLATGWKVYDIEIGGVSLVTNYRDTFGGEIRRTGIDGLIKSLQSKNQTGDMVAVKK